jgi:hypothetical protein
MGGGVNLEKLSTATALASFAVITTATTHTAHATTINCHHTGPVVGHPEMNYICYVHHDDAPTEIFYAP